MQEVLTVNTELFRKIQTAIEDESKLDMDNWETLNADICGTTRCVAGWAIALTTGAPVYAWRNRDSWFEVLHTSPETERLARSLGVAGDDVAIIATKLLGLDDLEGEIFYQDNETALQFIDLVVAGRDDLARALLISELED